MGSSQPAPVTSVRGSGDGRKSKRGGGGPDAVAVPNPQPRPNLSPEDEKLVNPSDTTTIDTKDVPTEPISSAPPTPPPQGVMTSPAAPPAPMAPDEVKAALAQNETPASNPLDTHPEALNNPAPFFTEDHEYVIEKAPKLSRDDMNRIPREFAMVAKIGTPAGIMLIDSRDTFDAVGMKTTLPCVEAKFKRVKSNSNIRRFNVMEVPEVKGGKVHWATVALHLMRNRYYMGDARTPAGMIYPWSDYQKNKADADVIQVQMQEERIVKELEIQAKASKRGKEAQEIIRKVHKAAAAAG